MTYKIITKNYLKPKNKTEVTISEEVVGKYTYIMRSLSGDRLQEDDETLIQAVLDLLVSEYDPSSKLDELSHNVELMRKTLEQQEQANAITQGALLEIGNLVYSHVEETEDEPIEDNPSDTDDTDEGGEEDVHHVISD